MNLINSGKIKPDSRVKSKIEKARQVYIPDFSHNVGIIEDKDTKRESIDLRELKYFLMNPIDLVLRRHLRLFDEDESDKSLEEVEPFFSEYPFDFRMIMDVLDHYVVHSDTIELDDYIEKYYQNSQLMGETPAGIFAEFDIENFRDTIYERTYSENAGLSRIIDRLKKHTFFRNIIIGEINSKLAPDRVFPSRFAVKVEPTSVLVPTLTPYCTFCMSFWNIKTSL